MLALRTVYAVAALFAAVEALECGIDLYGEETNDVINLPVQYLYDQSYKNTVTIPDMCQGFGKSLKGVYVRVCDDVKPTVKINSLYEATVRRHSKLWNPAPVYITEYCEDSYNSAYNERIQRKAPNRKLSVWLAF